MFAKKFRLSSNKKIFALKTIPTPLFILRIAKNNLFYNRYGFVVSKKVDKRAVVRNRLRRQFRSLLEKKNLQLPQGYDFLFSLKKQIAGIDRLQMEKELELTFQKLKFT